MKHSIFSSAESWFRKIVSDEFNRHKHIMKNEKITDVDIAAFNNILSKKGNADEFAQALSFLSNKLCEIYNEKVIILIDEYDVPLENAYFC